MPARPPQDVPASAELLQELARLQRENADLHRALRHAETQVQQLHDGLEDKVAERTRELEATSERLLAATSAANVGIWDWDVGNDWLVWDEQMHRLYGLPQAAFSGSSQAWRAGLHSEDAEAVIAALEAALAGTADFDFKYRIVTPSGLVRHIRAVASVHRDSSGAALRMRGVNWDISAEVLAQERLRINEERWNLALEGTGDGVWDWDLTTDEVFLSNRSRELLGYGGDAVGDPERSTLVHPEDLERVSEAMQRHVRGENPAFDCEFRVLRRDGSYLWILGRGRATARDADGKALRVLGTHKDVTEQRRAREELEHREALLREFITHTPAAIAMLDREMRYVQASRRWLTDYKLQGRDVIGCRHYDVFPDIPERWKEIHRRVLAGAIESCDEDPFPRADGGLEWLQWEARPWYDRSGGIGGLIFFTQVITERKELGLRLEEQNRQLSRSNDELEQFAYVASHDLQEPLRAIAGCTQILARRYQGKLDGPADTLIEHIVDGAARMKALIDDLLLLSRAGSQQQSTRLVDIAEVFQQALKNLDASIKEQDAIVSAGPLPVVQGDATQLLQLFQNLIGNGLKYRRGGRTEVTITAASIDGGHQFSVRDNGIGIDSRYFERVFGVFQRLHTREEYAGTGIGLAICRKIVERHRGKIWIESELGSGSVFHFTVKC